METGIFAASVVVMGGLALMCFKLRPFTLFCCGVGITIFGAMLGLELKKHGNAFSNQLAVGFGDIFLIFIAIVGGALVSAAFSELRSKFQANQKHGHTNDYGVNS